MKVIFDLYLFFRLLTIMKGIIYIRLSKYGIFLLGALYLRKHHVFLEVNGLAKEDQINSMIKAKSYKMVFSRITESLYMNLPNVSIISVAKEIEKTISKRYGVKRTYTIKNGCSHNLIKQYNPTLINNSRVINIGFLGTFTPWDGHEKTGELYEAVKKTGNKTIFHIAGPNVKKTIIYEKYSRNNDFIFHDTIPYKKLKYFYDKLDAAYAFDRIDRSRKVEQSTLKLLEYWASKIPILTTDAKGNDYVKKYKIGYLIKEKEYSDKEKFKLAVKEFIQSINKYKENYKNAPEPKSWKDVALETKAIIEN